LNCINYIWKELLKLNEYLLGNYREEIRFGLDELSLWGAKRIYLVTFISGCSCSYHLGNYKSNLKDTDKLLMKIFRRNSLE